MNVSEGTGFIRRVRGPVRVVAILLAGVFPACATVTGVGQDASHSVIQSPAPVPPGTLDLGSLVYISIDHVGDYVWQSKPLPGVLKAETKSLSVGFKIINGTVDYDQTPAGSLSDTPQGLLLTFSFKIASYTGTPSLVIIRAAAPTQNPVGS